MKLIKTYGPKWLGFSRYFPYPLRALRLNIVISPFNFWWPSYKNKYLSEEGKKDGLEQWVIRIAFFHISVSRWL